MLIFFDVDILMPSYSYAMPLLLRLACIETRSSLFVIAAYDFFRASFAAPFALSHISGFRADVSDSC